MRQTALYLAALLTACVPPTKHVDGTEWTDAAAGSPPRTDACSDGACTVCTTSAQCTGNPSTPVCDSATGTCVQCNSDADCPDASAAKCDASGSANMAARSNAHPPLDFTKLLHLTNKVDFGI